MRIFSFYFWFFQFPLWIFLIFLFWFIPWVFLLYLGVLVYFPYESDGKTRYLRVTGPVVGFFTDQWVAETDIPKLCKKALIAAEDNRYYDHIGVDFKSLQQNFSQNKKSFKLKRGGSTITQQLVKNAFLSREKNNIRKSREIIGALILNSIMSKEMQLGWYFNVVEFGSDIYGIENAARAYFNTSAKNLNAAQCVALVNILPSPNKWNQSIKNKSLTSFFIQRYNKINYNMKEMRFISSKESDIIKKMDLGFNNKSIITQKLQPNKNNIPKNSFNELNQNKSIFQEENEDDIDDE